MPTAAMFEMRVGRWFNQKLMLNRFGSRTNGLFFATASTVRRAIFSGSAVGISCSFWNRLTTW